MTWDYDEAMGFLRDCVKDAEWLVLKLDMPDNPDARIHLDEWHKAIQALENFRQIRYDEGYDRGYDDGWTEACEGPNDEWTKL